MLGSNKPDLAKFRLSMDKRMRSADVAFGSSTVATTSEPYALSPFVTLRRTHSGFCMARRSASSEAGYAAFTGSYLQRERQS